MSKLFLIQALKCEDVKEKAISSAALSYLAGLHFAASEYRIAIDIAPTVITNEKDEEEDAETLNAGCLLFIEDIAMIIGFYLIFMKARDPSLQYTRRQFFLDLRLTPEAFLQYIVISSYERTTSGYSFHNKIPQTPQFPMDVILMAVTNLKFAQKTMKRKDVLCVYLHVRADVMYNLKPSNEGRMPN